jgi:citrate synthase
MIEDADAKLMRPRQLFTGSDLRHYLPLAERP